MKLFFLSALLVIAMTFIFSGVDTNKMTFWQRLPWGILGILIPFGMLFLWLGMWRYWVRIDRSSRWLKRIWFVVLLIGFWWGSVLYYFLAYLPQMIRRRESEVRGADV
jgi:signal transduction histidine kinase